MCVLMWSCDELVGLRSAANVQLSAQVRSVVNRAGCGSRDLRSFVIRFDFESYVQFDIRFVLMV